MINKEEVAELSKELKGLDEEWKQEAMRTRKPVEEEAMELQRLYLRKMAVLLKDAEYIEKDAELYDVKITPLHILPDDWKPEADEIGRTSKKFYSDDGRITMTIVFEDSYVIVAWRNKKK